MTTKRTAPKRGVKKAAAPKRPGLKKTTGKRSAGRGRVTAASRALIERRSPDTIAKLVARIEGVLRKSSKPLAVSDIAAKLDMNKSLLETPLRGMRTSNGSKVGTTGQRRHMRYYMIDSKADPKAKGAT
jgi:hypothetical protein